MSELLNPIAKQLGFKPDDALPNEEEVEVFRGGNLRSFIEPCGCHCEENHDRPTWKVFDKKKFEEVPVIVTRLCGFHAKAPEVPARLQGIPSKIVEEKSRLAESKSYNPLRLKFTVKKSGENYSLSLNGRVFLQGTSKDFLISDVLSMLRNQLNLSAFDVTFDDSSSMLESIPVAVLEVKHGLR
jgi:hypothetical protein